MERRSAIAVVIASKGRPADLALWMQHMARQTYKPAMMVWSVTGPQDVPPALGDTPDAGANGGIVPVVVEGKPGLCCQRNTALAALPDTIDIVAFYDDDYIPCDDNLDQLERMFARHPEVVGLTGLVIADGINGPGISVEEANTLVERHVSVPVEQASLFPVTGLYGCNMAMRRAVIGGDRFDENLPLYGWQEDVDFARQIARKGLIHRTDAFAGVHRGAKGGRVSGVRFGYSQVANVIYLMRKGTMPLRYGGKKMVRNILANHARMLRPEPWVDRRGRVVGNWRALADLMAGRLHPGRVLDI